MKKVLLLLPIIIALLLIANNISKNTVNTAEDILALEDVLIAFKKSGLDLVPTKKNMRVFALNGEKSKDYEFKKSDKYLVSIYIFTSREEREKGMEDFYMKTANLDMNVKIFEIKNSLILFFGGTKDDEYHLKVQRAADLLKKH